MQATSGPRTPRSERGARARGGRRSRRERRWACARRGFPAEEAIGRACGDAGGIPGGCGGRSVMELLGEEGVSAPTGMPPAAAAGAKGQGHQGFPAPLDSPTFPLDATPFGRASKSEGPTGAFGAPRRTPLIEAELFAARANALHRMAAHCHARRLTQGKFRA